MISEINLLATILYQAVLLSAHLKELGHLLRKLYENIQLTKINIKITQLNYCLEKNMYEPPMKTTFILINNSGLIKG